MTNQTEEKTLYVGYMADVEGWSKIGLTTKSFKGRWAGHNAGFPPPVHMLVDYEVILPREAAEAVEREVLRKFDDLRFAEWLPLNHDILTTFVHGVISRKRLKNKVRKRKAKQPVATEDYAFPVDSLKKTENSSLLELPSGEMEKELQKCDESMKNLYFGIFRTFIGLGKHIVPDYEPKKYVRFNKAGKALGSIGMPAVKRGFFKIHLKLNPSNERLEEGFTRDMKGRGFNGVGHLEITIKNSDDIDKALPLFTKAYKEN